MIVCVFYRYLNEQGQGGTNDKLVISTACEETGLGTVGMQQSRSLANQRLICYYFVC